jgi:hypothetical protein
MHPLKYAVTDAEVYCRSMQQVERRKIVIYGGVLAFCTRALTTWVVRSKSASTVYLPLVSVTPTVPIFPTLDSFANPMMCVGRTWVPGNTSDRCFTLEP